MSLKALRFSAFIAVIVWLVWYQLASPQPFLYIAHYWEITLTMVFGSLIAGATSEGGGAVAFPVFTKVLSIAPQEAKMFSLAIQSVGMSAASLAIVYMGIAVEWRVIRWASLGGLLGLILSAVWLVPVLTPPVIKMSFTAMITSFAITLWVLNRRKTRLCHQQLPIFRIQERFIILLAGFLGGIMGSLVGNGIDVITFSFMVLLFRISEKVATPTSVILMAINAVIGFAGYSWLMPHLTGQIYWTTEVQAYWLAAVPIVVVGAPLGAMICSLLNRITIARFLIALIIVELVSSLWIIPLTPLVVVSSVTTLVVFSGLYAWMYGVRRYEPHS